MPVEKLSSEVKELNGHVTLLTDVVQRWHRDRIYIAIGTAVLILLVCGVMFITYQNSQILNSYRDCTEPGQECYDRRQATIESSHDEIKDVVEAEATASEENLGVTKCNRAIIIFDATGQVTSELELCPSDIQAAVRGE